MATSKKSNGKKLKDPTSSVGVTPVNLLVRLANGEEKKIRDTCGLGLEKPLANYDPTTQSWKMFGDISLWGDCRLLVNLPPSGMTVNGVLFLQPAWVPITGETESLSWPTPMASDSHYRLNGNSQASKNLQAMAIKGELAMWPTPTTQEVEHPTAKLTETGRRKSKKGTTSHSLGLADAVRLWPTPTVDDANNVNPKANRFHGLVAEVNQYPTMSALGMGNTGSRQKLQKLVEDGSLTDEEKRAMTAGNGGKLNPTWVEWLMGFPLGWTDLEDSETL
jgi:hypothetical protein